MRISIHQPCYLPWIPFIDKALRSDVFVFLDDVQFEKNSFQNRNRIKTSRGKQWLTVPVTRTFTTLVNEVLIANNQTNWRKKHIRAIELNYRKSPYFDEIAPQLFGIILGDWSRLIDLNLAISNLFFSLVRYEGRIYRSSELNVQETKSRKILEICRILGAKTYLSGKLGINYLKTSEFLDSGIEVLFQDYRYGHYPQQFGSDSFIPGLSAIDFFMNVGVGDSISREIVGNSRWVTASEMAKSSGDMF